VRDLSGLRDRCRVEELGVACILSKLADGYGSTVRDIILRHSTRGALSVRRVQHAILIGTRA
jgi:hypothetical protein